MTNSERLLLYTLPRWAGVTALSIREPLNDMWLGGEEAGHHAGKPYDPVGYRNLRAELLKDFRRAPALKAFGASGNIRTVRDLAAAMAGIAQTPVPSTSAVLASLLPRDEVAILSRQRLRAVLFHEYTALDTTKGRSKSMRMRPKKTSGRKRRRDNNL